MGYSVLYIAFGIVALWLLGEVLLQYKARLRWRLLAFGGFLCVVAGVALGQVAVIVLGALAFGAGQAFVTLSYKRGFSTGWALGGRPGSSRRRRAGGPRATEAVLEVSPVEEEFSAGKSADGSDPDFGGGFGGDFAGEFGSAAGGGFGADAAGTHPRDELHAGPADPREDVYQPVPMHDDSGEYPLYDGQSSYTPDPYTSGGYEGYGAQGYGGWDGEAQPAAASYGYDGGHQGGYDPSGGWGGQPGPSDTGQQYGGPQQDGPQSDGPQHDYGFDQGGGYQEQQPAASYDGYDQHATGVWTPQPPADPYGYGYPYQQEQPQPYIPQQQPPYDPDQPPYEPRPAPQYADPYDPYRY